MTNYNFGDVVLVPFPFTDQTDTKKRPAIVVSSQEYNDRLRDPILSDYERDKLRPHPEMIARFAQAMSVTTDELLGVKPLTGSGDMPSLKLLRRLKKIEGLPSAKQKALLKTIDMVLNAAEK